MRIIDKGVLKSSFMEFTLPSVFAQKALYYTPQFGHFICEKGYDIERNSLDLFLMLFICDGSLVIQTQDRNIVASKNQIVLLDCRKPHRYFCPNSTEFSWFHFNGCSSAAYTEYLYNQFGIVFSGNHIPLLKKNFDFILSNAQISMPNEHAISLHITKILSSLADPEKRTIVLNELLNPAIHYIGQHYAHTIDLDQLAALCNISTSHFIRSFKKYLHCTPHEYLLLYRLRQAKQFLIITELSIEQIAERCGFNSASHFARAFRKNNNMSPSEFRTMQF